MKKPKISLGQFLAAGIGLIALIAGMGSGNKAPSAASSSGVAFTSPAPSQRAAEPSLAERAASAMPDAQKKFIAAVEKGREAFEAGANEMQKGAARPARAKNICSTPPSMTVKNRVGQVENLSSNGDGKGVLSIAVAKDVYVKTWNNALSDTGDKTLIEPDTAIFAKASALTKGGWVSFSGSFVRANSDCILESSMTLRGSLREPEFIFQFSDINPT